jgi:hypothetical protein
VGTQENAVTRAAVQAALTDYLTKVMQEQGGPSLRKTEQVKRAVLDLFKGIPQGTMWVQGWLEHTTLGDPAQFAAEAVRFLPEVVPAANLSALQHAPVKQAPAGPKTLGQTIRGALKEQLDKLGHPEEGAGSPSDRALPPAPKPEPPAKAPGEHMLKTPQLPWEYPWVKAPPKRSQPQAELDPQAESAAARVDPGALTPAGAHGDFADAREFARAVARALDAAQQAKRYSVFLELGAEYANVKDRGAIYQAAQQIILAIRDGLPHKASEVTEVWLTINGQQKFRVLLHPPAD